MRRVISVAGRTHAAPLLLTILLAAACMDFTGLDSKPPGRRLLHPYEFERWIWLPGGQEILYSTPFKYPYTGPPARLDAVDVSTGKRRTVVAAPTNGDRIVGYRFSAQGSHVYFEMSPASSSGISLYRAPIDGSSPPEMLVDSANYGIVVSPDERTVAWVQVPPERSAEVVTVDIASGARRAYPLRYHGETIVWAPSGRALVVGTSLWLDLATGTFRSLAPSGQLPDRATLHYGWEGDMPVLYTTGGGYAVRHSLATGARETLATIPLNGRAVGWSPDFENVVIATWTCLDGSSDPSGPECRRWKSSVYRLEWRSGQRGPVLRHEGKGRIGGRLSPTGSWLAYEYGWCTGCEYPAAGMYAVPIR